MIDIRLFLPLCISLSLAACGGGGGSDSGGGTVTPPPANRAPVLDAIGDQQLFEGGTGALTVLSASDADGDALTFSLSGADAVFFDITAESELVPNAAFDYEAAEDDDQNNDYELVVLVSDGTASDEEALTIVIRDALEGRVVDGPVSGATVVVSGEAGDLTNEVETDESGFWLIPEDIDGDGLQVKSTGGVDTVTGKALADLVLISDVPADVSGSVNVNAITTILSIADTAEQKSEILESLGIDASPEELIGSDIWEEASEGDESAQAAQRINAQLNLIIVTTQTIISSNTGDQFDAETAVVAVAEAIVDAVTESGEADLANSEVIVDVISDSVAAVAPDADVSAEVVEVVSEAVADTNTILGDETVDPTSETAAGVAAAGQEDLQEAVEDVSTGQTDVGTFVEETDPEILYDDVPVEDEVPDTDGDGLADTVDPDDDNDGVRDGDDTFPLDGSESVDTDGDGIGNNADTDDDGDVVADTADAFPLDPTESLDTDNDGVGNNADADDDGDGVADADDAFELDETESLDTDGDGIGNNADPDDDNDGVADADDSFELDETESVDTDGDGIGNNADLDDDNDGVLDVEDAFELDETESVDTDNDGIGDNADTDDDGDLVPDLIDAFALNPTESVDTDGDGIGNNADPDDDNDGVLDAEDAFEFDETESVDTDGDGIGNNADPDDDNDGVLDADDAFEFDATESVDTDGDGIGNNADTDDDNDGVADAEDAFELDETESLDSDGDGIGNNADPDDDNDGVADADDAFELDEAESVDTDGDGIGNNADTDDDGDGIPDGSDPNPEVPETDTDGDGVADFFDDYPNDAANFTDTDGDGVYDFFDADPADASNAKAIRFSFDNVDKAGVSESLSEAESTADATESDWRTQIAGFIEAVGSFLFAQTSIAEDVGPDLTSELDSVTNLITWDEQGFVLQDTIESNESMFVAESVLTPNGEFVYLLTSPSMQRALSDGGRLQLQVDSCQLYRVDVKSGKFSCLLDENDPEINSVLKNSVWRDDFLRAGISFRADGVGVLESSQGPMVLYTDGSYSLFNETLRQAPEGFMRDIGTIVWLDDSHIGISTSFFPEGGGGTTSYWTAFNLASGNEVDEIEGTDFRVVVHEGSIYTNDGRVTWTGSEFQSDGQGYAAIQDIYGNLWDKGGVYGLTLVDETRGLQLSLGEEGTEGPNIYLGSGTGTGIAYRDFAFDDYWVLNKYSRKASDTITSVMGVAYDPNEPLFIDLEAPNGALIKLTDPDLWYYLRSGNETDDVVISYEVTLSDGESETRVAGFPIEAIESFAAFDPTIYDASSYENGYEILQQNGEGIALEGPNPEAEEQTFCVFNALTQQQQCAALSEYSVLRTDLENIRNNSERHYSPSSYACPDNSCQAMPGMQNVVFGGEGLLVFFKDSTDNQYYKASADLETFMIDGDTALTVTPVVNGAGESEIVASTASLVDDIQREVDVSRLSPFAYDFDTNKVIINFGVALSELVELPNISVTLDSSDEAVEVASSSRSDASTDVETTVEYQLAESALALSGAATVDLTGAFFFVKDSPLRYGWDDTGSVTLGDSTDTGGSGDTGGGTGAGGSGDTGTGGSSDTGGDTGGSDPADTDGDGVIDDNDEYPQDPYRGFDFGLPDVDGVRLSFTGVQVVDYINGSTENIHYLDPSAAAGSLDLSIPAPLDLSNLYDLVGSSSLGKAPAIRFALDTIPSAGSSGTATLVTKIFDGQDAVRDSGERVISAVAVINWASDGSIVTLTAPAQSSAVTLVDESGVGITRNFNNAEADVMSFSASGSNAPASLELKLTSYISSNLTSLGLDPSGFFEAGSYYFTVEVDGLPLFDSLSAPFDTVAGVFNLQEDPGVYMYPLPRVVSSTHTDAAAEVRPSRATSRELCTEWRLSSDNGAASSSGICFVNGIPDLTIDVRPKSNSESTEVQLLSVFNATGGNGIPDDQVFAVSNAARILVVDVTEADFTTVD